MKFFSLGKEIQKDTILLEGVLTSESILIGIQGRGVAKVWK